MRPALILAAALLAGCAAPRADSPLALDRGWRQSDGAAPARRAPSASARAYAVDYSFQSFDGAPLTVRFEVDKAAYDAAEAAWGYSEEELAGLRAKRDAARRDLFERAQAESRTQEQLERELDSIQRDYRRLVDGYMSERGFILGQGGLARVDLPALARRSAPALASVAGQLERQARERGEGVDWQVAAAASLVQTALDYREVPAFSGGRHIGGVWRPEHALLEGWGDCDTKTALLAAILYNWPGQRMIVVELPDHFLLGLDGPARPGLSTLRWRGRSWTLIEPAGPAWLPPGYLGQNTKALLESGHPYQVSPVP